MLILTRKQEEQIMIGEDVTLTICRIDGNRVKVGIQAPEDVRIMRGELAAKQEVEFELSEREMAFAHPQPKPNTKPKASNTSKPSTILLEGSVRRDGSKPMVKRALADGPKGAPLAGFVSAS